MIVLSYVVVALAMLALGIAIGRISIVVAIKSGRVVFAGRVYWCKDTGPLVRCPRNKR